jgi:hypothetical protein
VILFACIVNWPCLWWGLQFGHDHNLHITYLSLFGAQLRAGELYPRWISALNFGAGSPIFFVQYPLPFFVSAGLQWALHLPATPVGEAHALGLFVFLTGILSGVAAWLWCRTLTSPVVAMFASLAYLTMPYVYACDVYYRAAIGEYSALTWVPLTLFFAHQIGARPMRAVAGTAFTFAAIIPSNLFTAVLFTPFLLAYFLCCAPRGRIVRSISLLMLALALGVGISGVYFLPMSVHRSFFSTERLNALGPNIFNYKDHLFPISTALFPSSEFSVRLIDVVSEALGVSVAFTLALGLRKSHISKLLAILGIVVVLATCAAPMLHLVRLFPHPETAIARVTDVRGRIFLASFLTLEAALLAYASLRRDFGILPKFFLAASLGCYFLSTRWSGLLWEHALVMTTIQFPWRLSGILSVFALGLLAYALSECWKAQHRYRRLLLCAGVWLVVAGGGYLALNIPRNLTPPFFTEFRKNKIESAYPAYASISEFPKPEELGPNDGLLTRAALVSGEGSAQLAEVSARHLRLKAECHDSCTVLVKLVYYPFWRAHEGTNSIPLQASKRAGLTELQLSSGAHEIDLELPVERAEVWGAWLTVFSCIGATVLFFTRGRVCDLLPVFSHGLA